MLYKAKEGSKAYEYIKSVIEAEDKEKEAYYNRVEQIVGFKIKSYSGYTPNKSLVRKYEISALLVDDTTWDNLDKKLWKQTDVVRGFHKIVPIKRTKKGKEIANVFNSYKEIATHWDIFNELNVGEPNSSYFSITQLLCNLNNGTYMVYFDDSVRADKDNPELIEITMSEYDKIMKE